MVDWTHWHNEPLLIGTLVLAAWAYALAAGPWRGHLAPGAPFPGRAARRFVPGLLLFYGAVGSPLDQLGERYLFSAHMVQHMVIVYAVAPLVLNGLPAWLVDRVLTIPVIGPALRRATHPVAAGALFVLCISFWHAPIAYDWALREKLLHVAQHLMFLGTGLLMWWPLLGTSHARPRLLPGAQVLYLTALGALQMPLVAFLVFSRTVLYPTYEYAPRLTSLTPRDDQILGGAIMGVGGMFISLGLISWAFYCWHRFARQDDAATSLSGTTP